MVTVAPKPIDPRGPRLNQAVLSVAMLGAYVFGVWPLVPLFGVVLALGVVLGPRYNPVLRFFSEVVQPKLAPPAFLEDPRPPRFAALIGAVFLTLATCSYLADIGALGDIFTLIVAALAGLAATTGVCVGCEAYLLIVKRRDVKVAP